ncbi:MAG: 50S ribosomal protein L4 [Desulfobacterales bacterium C00003060]|nr:MAG: 50S ribosomal protein L4 [Desulfobacterales bacterium S3730MH5]OEU79238.1 MAG: 50S ribosomal protein L4 [Desulfobacterales bacterium C00003060]OEU81074.1 MAG: 50S ribosomal protein L4 [Desulfobacterales bacterium S5133MH4]
MALQDVYNVDGIKVSQIDLADEIFNIPIKQHVLHEVVTMQLANKRVGTASTKGRSEVRGGGQKPYRQKGTGRARAGSRSSPLWRGGGVVFGPGPRSYAYKVPKKVRRQALKMALTSKLQKKALIVVDKLDLESVKTKRFVEIMRALKTREVLIVTEGKLENLELSSRNVPRVKVVRWEGLNVYDILRFKHLVLLESSVGQLEGRLLS